MARKLAIAVAVASLIAAGAAVAATSSGGLLLGPAGHTRQITYKGFYDGHKDTYLITDVSSKSQAKALHVNYSTELSRVKNLPAQYFVKGRHAAGQLAVFGSEPGESDYNPLWVELFVTWKQGVKPKLLVKDDQINRLAKHHKLTIRNSHIVLNAPIIKVG